MNPDLSRAEQDALERENFAVLMANQALIGNVTPEMKAVAILLEPETLRVRFAIEAESADVAEAIEDVTTDLDVYLSHLADAPDLDVQVVIGAVAPEWQARPWRMVYAARLT